MSDLKLDFFLDAIKDRLPLASHLESDGVKLTRAGGLHKACCPFHGESTPSFFVYPDGHYHCFGGCNAHGDIIDYEIARRGGDWWETVCDLAKIARVPVPERTPEQQQQAEKQRAFQGTLAEYVAQCHRALMAHEEALSYLKGRGLTDETIRDRQIGIATVKTDDPKLLSIQGRIVFPVIRGGKVVNLVCRSRKGEEPKYLNLPGVEIVPFDSHLLRGKEVILCEGVLDALLLQQAGFPAVATIGCRLKVDHVGLVGNDTRVALAYDGDKAGTEATHANGALLTSAGREARVISLPEGMDPADAVTQLDADTLKKMINAAKSLITWEIERLPRESDLTEIDRFCRELLYPLLAKESDVIAGGALDYAAEWFAKLKLTPLKADFQKFRKSQAGEGKKGDEDGEKTLTPRSVAECPRQFNPAQHFSKEIAGYTLHLPVQGDSGMHPFFITSKREIFPLQPSIAAELGLIYRANKYPTEEMPRWPIGTNSAFNYEDWLNEKAAANPTTLYLEVRDLLKRHIYFPEEETYDVVTLWALGTYVYQCFVTYPYIHIRAIQGSGKSTLLQILEVVCFNGEFSEKWTESTISRLVNSDSATLLLDEAENYNRKSKDEQSAIFEVLKGGYKRGATSRKASSKRDNFKPETFDTYSPKAFGSTKPIDSILGQRCIDVRIEKSQRGLQEWDSENAEDRLAPLRGHCYFWALQEWEELRETYLSINAPEGWINREWEIWKPLFVLARHFEIRIGRPLVDGLIPFARKICWNKKEREKEADPSNQQMAAIVEFVASRRPGFERRGERGYHTTSDLIEHIKESLGWAGCDGKQIGDMLCDTLGVCDRSDRQRISAVHFKGTPWAWRICEERVARQARRLFGWDDEALGGLAGLGLDPDEAHPSIGIQVEAEDPFEDAPADSLSALLGLSADGEASAGEKSNALFDAQAAPGRPDPR